MILKTTVKKHGRSRILGVSSGTFVTMLLHVQSTYSFSPRYIRIFKNETKHDGVENDKIIIIQNQ